MYHRQRLPITGSGLGHSFFLAVTLSSGQVEWPASLGSHSFEVHSCEQFRRIVRLEVDAGQTFLEGRLILSRLHLFGVGGMAQGGNGLDSYSSRADSFSPGYTLFGVGGMAQGGE
jgi:hypothetical protein